MIVLGIDPGISGAFAVVHRGRCVKIFDMPVMTHTKGGKVRQTYDGPKTNRFLRELKELAEQKGESLRVALEDLSYRPSNGGIGAQSFAVGYGRLLAYLEINEIPFETVSANSWRPKMVGVKKSKADALKKARQLFPKAPLTLAKHHNRAEALLIAEYAIRYLGWGG